MPLVLGNKSQVETLIRSARYCGYKCIENPVLIAEDCEPNLLMRSALEQISDENVGQEQGLKFAHIVKRTDPSSTSFVAFDTETTGLGRDVQITDIGAVRVVDGEIVERFQMYANPGRPISKRVAELTGITDADVADAEPCANVAAAFREFAGDALLVGHNIHFNLRALANTALPAGNDFDNEYFDTRSLVTKLRKAFGWDCVRLGYLCEEPGIELTRAHRDLPDAEATTRLYLKLRNLL